MTTLNKLTESISNSIGGSKKLLNAISLSLLITIGGYNNLYSKTFGNVKKKQKIEISKGDLNSLKNNFQEIKNFYSKLSNKILEDNIFDDEDKEIVLDDILKHIVGKIENSQTQEELNKAISDLESKLLGLLSDNNIGPEKIKNGDIEDYKIKVLNYIKTIRENRAKIYTYDSEYGKSKVFEGKNVYELADIMHEKKVEIIKNKLFSELNNLNSLGFQNEENLEKTEKFVNETKEKYNNLKSMNELANLIESLQADIKTLKGDGDFGYLGGHEIYTDDEDFDDNENIVKNIDSLLVNIEKIKGDIDKPLEYLIERDIGGNFEKEAENINKIKSDLQNKQEELRNLYKDKENAENNRNNYVESKFQLETNLEILIQEEQILKDKAQNNLLKDGDLDKKKRIEEDKLNTKTQIDSLNQQIENIEKEIESIKTEMETKIESIKTLQENLTKQREDLIKKQQINFSNNQTKTIDKFKYELNQLKKEIEQKKLEKVEVKKKLEEINGIINNITETNNVSDEISQEVSKYGIQLDVNDAEKSLENLRELRDQTWQEYKNIDRYISYILMNTIYNQIQPYKDQNTVLENIKTRKLEDIKSTEQNIGEFERESKIIETNIEQQNSKFDNLAKQLDEKKSSTVDRQRLETFKNLKHLKDRLEIVKQQIQEYIEHKKEQSIEVERIADLKKYYNDQIQYLDYLGNAVIFKNSYDVLELERNLLVNNTENYSQKVIELKEDVEKTELEYKEEQESEKTIIDEGEMEDNLERQYELKQEIENKKLRIKNLEKIILKNTNEIEEIEEEQDMLIKAINTNIQQRNGLITAFEIAEVAFDENGCHETYCATSIPIHMLEMSEILKRNEISFEEYKSRGIEDLKRYYKGEDKNND